MNDKLNALKTERVKIEKLLQVESTAIDDANFLLNELKSIFLHIDKMTTYKPYGRIRYIRFLMESKLSQNVAFFNCYGRFTNLWEGIEA
jgi:hypothetical protein